MKERICYVVGAGENYGFDFQPVTGDFDTLKCIAEHPNCHFYFANLICSKVAVGGYFISPRYTICGGLLFPQAGRKLLGKRIFGNWRID